MKYDGPPWDDTYTIRLAILVIALVLSWLGYTR